MQLLKDRIRKDGKIKEGNVLKVDSFLNHQMDVKLFQEIGKEFKRRFEGEEITKILTIEASGIGIACIVAEHFDVPAVFAKKSQSINLDGEMYVAEVESFTHKCKNNVIVSQKFLSEDDHVLIIDDFLANGCALQGLIQIVPYSAEHLVQCGCKNIVCLKEPSGYSSGNERYRGYFAVCEKYGLKEQSVDCTYVYEEGIRAAGKMLERYPDVDGVIAGNDMIAMAVYKELIRRGKKIPQEIQLIGFDDVKFGQIFTPELTTIHQSIREMGTAAAQIIEKCVEGQPCQKKNIFDVSLVVRETTMEW